MSTSSTPTILSVLAHPDDESFGMGGTLALYAERGAKVHLICATRGEAGTLDADCLEGFSSVAERRESELRCAAGILGLAGVYFLGYRDSGMPGSPDNDHPEALVGQPVEEVAAAVAHLMRQIRPQVVLTFDPIGGYKHPDHIAIHKATLRAFEMASDPAFADEYPPYQPQKLYFHIIPKGMLKVAVSLLRLVGRDPRKFGRNGDIDLAVLVEEGDFPVHAAIDIRKALDKKDAASACHASQLGGTPRRGPVAWLLKQMGGKNDLFMRAFPEPNQHRERDLFEGVQ
jgi:LmbE family N-acetylglucosaminyl deacetylase